MDLAMQHSLLERQIAIAFEGAIRCDRLDIAEHLLDALELLDPEPGPGAPLARACLSFADGIPCLDRPLPGSGATAVNSRSESLQPSADE